MDSQRELWPATTLKGKYKQSCRADLKLQLSEEFVRPTHVPRHTSEEQLDSMSDIHSWPEEGIDIGNVFVMSALASAAKRFDQDLIARYAPVPYESSFEVSSREVDGELIKVLRLKGSNAAFQYRNAGVIG